MIMTRDKTDVTVTANYTGVRERERRNLKDEGCKGRAMEGIVSGERREETM